MPVALTMFLILSLTQVSGSPAAGPVPAQLGFPLNGVFGDPALADFDGDGLEEILFTDQFFVYAYRGDGRSVSGWPVSLTGCGLVNSMVLAGDIDGDGVIEVVATKCDQVFVYQANGLPQPGWPVQLPMGTTPNVGRKISLGDVDGDGDLEVIVVADLGPGVVHVLGEDGQNLPGWPKGSEFANVGEIAGVAAGDVDFDGVDEVVVATRSADPVSGNHVPSPLFLFHGDGSAWSGWPIYLPPPENFRSVWYPVIADLDGDWVCEIFGTGGSSLSGVHLDGTWAMFPSGIPANNDPPAVGDLDADGELEVVVTGTLLGVRDGSLMTLSDETTYWNYDGSAALADVDGDGDLEIAVWSRPSSVNSVHALHLYHHDLTHVDGWPLEFPSMLSTGQFPRPAFSDLDGDGDLELIVSLVLGIGPANAYVQVFDLPSDGTIPSSVAWGSHGHDSTNSFFYHRGQIPHSHFLRGDANSNETIDLGDVFCIIDAIVEGVFPDCPAAMDFNVDQEINLQDIVAQLSYMFLSQGAPAGLDPWPDCGPAPEETELPCPVPSCPE